MNYTTVEDLWGPDIAVSPPHTRAPPSTPTSLAHGISCVPTVHVHVHPPHASHTAPAVLLPGVHLPDAHLPHTYRTAAQTLALPRARRQPHSNRIATDACRMLRKRSPVHYVSHTATDVHGVHGHRAACSVHLTRRLPPLAAQAVSIRMLGKMMAGVPDFDTAVPKTYQDPFRATLYVLTWPLLCWHCKGAAGGGSGRCPPLPPSPLHTRLTTFPFVTEPSTPPPMLHPPPTSIHPPSPSQPSRTPLLSHTYIPKRTHARSLRPVIANLY